jgi:periplasmic protein TonB
VSATLSLPGHPAMVDAGPRRSPLLFGTVRHGEDGRFWRRLLRLLPLAIALHLVAMVVLLTVHLAPRPIPEEPPRVVFLRALPPARPAGAPAASAPAAHPIPPKARVAPKKREIRPPVVPPKEMPPEQPPPAVATMTESSATPSASGLASGPAAPAHGGSGGLGVTGDAPVGLGEITRPPNILHSPRPQYPSAAKSMGITGRVLVRVVVDVAGRVEAGSARVLRSVPGLDAAALAAIVQWRFSSSVDRAGRPVRVILDIPVEFSLR